MRTLLRRTSVLVLLGFEVTVVLVLHRLGAESWMQIHWSELTTWLDRTAAEDALAAVIRAVALVLAYWMLTTTALYVAARLLRVPTALRAVEWATIPAVRRVVDGAVAVSIATASIAGPAAPALAQVPTPVVVEIDDEGRPIPPGMTGDLADESPDATTTPVPPGLDRVGWTPTPAGIPAKGSPPVLDSAGARPTAAPTSVVVERGDHLWAISAHHLEQINGAPANDPTIARFWRRVVDANRDRLRSGNPDLIYPGETVVLPPIDLEES